MKKSIVPTAVVLCSLVIFGVSSQYFRYREGKLDNEVRLEENRKILNKIEYIEKSEENSKKIDGELSELDAVLSHYRLIIPEFSTTDQFHDQLKRWSKEINAKIENFSSQKEKYKGFYGTVSFSFLLTGSKENIEAFVIKMHDSVRLICVDNIISADRGVTIQLTVYYSVAWYQRSKIAYPSRNKVWLWPFSKWLEKTRQQVKEKVKEITPHEETRKKIELLENKKMEFERIKTIVEQLEKCKAS